MYDYDKVAVGERIRLQRKVLNMSPDEFAERIGRVPRFCSDIERGQAGMSIDTMLNICSLLKISPNFLLLGKSDCNRSNETEVILSSLDQCTEKRRQDALALLKLFLTAVDS